MDGELTGETNRGQTPDPGRCCIQCTTGPNETVVAHYDLLPEGSFAYRISGNNLVVRNRYAALSIGKFLGGFSNEILYAE